MAQALQELGLQLGYNSAESDLIHDFYVPCLDVSSRYDRAVGYFRSSIYSLVGVAVSDFALRGGRMRVVCSPSLAPEDIEALGAQSRQQDEVLSNSLTREIESVLAHPENVPVVELLATLLQAGTLELKVAYRPDATGIFHEKLGLFHSPTDSLTFSGSANETFSAWDPSANHEGIETFGSWDEGDSRRVTRHIEYFDNLWNDRIGRLTVRSLPDVPAETLSRFANSAGVEVAVEKARSHLDRVARLNRRNRRQLQAHQLHAVESWLQCQRGIIDHVTGAGKTLSALEVARRWLESSNRNCVIVLVPGDLLSQQWMQELRTELGDLSPSLLMVGGSLGNEKWRDRLSAFTSPSPAGPRVVVATVASASKEDFVTRVSAGPHLLVVADEVHSVGSPAARSIMSIDAGGRLGLSATPERFHDAEGTQRIFDYFGPILPPPFGIPEALAAGRLVPYDYHVRTVLLDADEAQDYEQLTKKITVLQARINQGADSSLESGLEMLRIRRARVVKKARNKVATACDLLAREYSDGQKWLLYCEDSDQLNEVTGRLVSQGLQVLEYHTQMLGDAPATLRSFQRYGGVLVSIRCLDQGVDIPTIDHALILASSTNPRQFIQRRGRVLRSTAGKYSADIYDLLVCKSSEAGELVLNRDLDRARVFASTARNAACRFKLDELQAALEDVGIEFENEQEDESFGA